MVALKTYSLHETGSKKNQEDYIWPVANSVHSNDTLFIVCDGVGGTENGEIASRIVAEKTASILQSADGTMLQPDDFKAALHAAQRELSAVADRESLSRDLATTIALVLFRPTGAWIAWCGDSRVYQIRSGRILFRTEDHSLVNQLVKQGEITEAESANHPQRNIILKALRAEDAAPEADVIWINDLQPGDYFVLCTDGLLEQMSDNLLCNILLENDQTPFNPAERMLEICRGRTRDNFSAYIIQLVAGQEPAAKKNRVIHPAFYFAGGALLLLILWNVFLHQQKATAVLHPPDPVRKSADSIQPATAPKNSIPPKTEKKPDSLDDFERFIEEK